MLVRKMFFSDSLFIGMKEKNQYMAEMILASAEGKRDVLRSGSDSHSVVIPKVKQWVMRRVTIFDAEVDAI